MAKGNTYMCKTCGTKYTYCPQCEFKTLSFDKESFCCGSHADIFAILSKNGCHLATAEETLNALKDYDLIGLSDSVQTHIDSLKSEVKSSVKVEAKSSIKEEIKTPIEEK